MAGGWGARPGAPALAAGKGASSMAGQAGLGSPLVCYCFLVSPLRIPPAPQCLLTGWQPGTVTPQTCSHPCFQRVPAMPSKTGSRASPLYLAPAPPRGNPQTSVVHCRDLASCEAGAAASLCSGLGGSVAQKAPETTGFQAGFLCSGDRNQLWLKPSQREAELGQSRGRPTRAGLGRARHRPVGAGARARQLGGAAERIPLDTLVGHPFGITKLLLCVFFSLNLL